MKMDFDLPKKLHYTSKHEWIDTVDEKNCNVGITDYAQQMMKEIVFVELPDIGKKVKKMESIATVESVKSVSEIFAPLSGEVTEVNKKLESEPELINKDPYSQGWIFKIKIDDKKEIEELMDSEKYKEHVDKLSE